MILEHSTTAQDTTEPNMSKQLIESIIDDNLIEANEVFKERMEHILECKLYENKRMLQAEGIGGALSKAEIEMRRKAGFVPASEKLTDPRSKAGQSEASKKLEKMIKKKRKLEEMKLSGEVGGTLGRKVAAAGIKLARKLSIGKDFSKRYLKGRMAEKGEAQQSADNAASLRAAGAEPSDAKKSDSSSKSVLSRAKIGRAHV